MIEKKDLFRLNVCTYMTLSSLIPVHLHMGVLSLFSLLLSLSLPSSAMPSKKAWLYP